MKKEKVCIAISSYNQEQYISQCLDHLIAQKGDYDVEILVCDDASQDRTKEIIFEKLQDVSIKGWEVKDHTNQENLGMPENTKRILRLLRESDADYGCILEGDDYWLSPFWLIKHVAGIKSDECASMSNNYLLFYDQKENTFAARVYPPFIHQAPYITGNMQAEDNWTGNFSSNLYSISALKSLSDDFLEQLYVDDWFINLLLAQQGKIVSIKEPLSVYRVHEAGVWSGRRKVTNCSENTISQRIRYMHEHYPGQYYKELSLFSEKYAHIPMMGKLYYDTGNGFNEEQTIPVYLMFQNKEYVTAQVDLEKLPSHVKHVRYDPVEGYPCELEGLHIFLDEKEVKWQAENGEKTGDVVTFTTVDPIILLHWPQWGIRKPKFLTLTANLRF